MREKNKGKSIFDEKQAFLRLVFPIKKFLIQS